eukprot:1160269-Pelagomonas_calceolata.AAC.9
MESLRLHVTSHAKPQSNAAQRSFAASRILLLVVRHAVLIRTLASKRMLCAERVASSGLPTPQHTAQGCAQEQATLEPRTLIPTTQIHLIRSRGTHAFAQHPAT